MTARKPGARGWLIGRAALVSWGALSAMAGFGPRAFAADVFTPLRVRDVHVGGKIGRRIAITLTNNLLLLQADRDFLEPFRSKNPETDTSAWAS